MTDPQPAPATPATEAKANVFEDFIDIIASPAKVFARRATASPGVPFLVVIVLIVAIFFANRNVMSAIMDAEIAKGMEAGMRANPQVTPEQMATGMKFARMITSGGAVIAVPISLLLLGCITWLVARICGGSPGYGTALLISAFAWVPRVLEGDRKSVV